MSPNTKYSPNTPQNIVQELALWLFPLCQETKGESTPAPMGNNHSGHGAVVVSPLSVGKGERTTAPIGNNHSGPGAVVVSPLSVGKGEGTTAPIGNYLSSRDRLPADCELCTTGRQCNWSEPCPGQSALGRLVISAGRQVVGNFSAMQ